MKQLAGALVIAMALVRGAAAAPADDARAAFAEGQRLYAAEDYVGAAARFRVAHGLDPDPVYLFNVAQAYRYAKRCADAVTYYRRYLQDAPSAPNVADVERFLEEVEACATAQAEPPDPVEPEPSDLVAPLGPEPERRDDPDRGSGRRMAGIVIGVAGVVAVANGFYFMSRVGQHEDDRRALCPAPCTWTAALSRREADLESKGNRDSTIMVASFAVGGAALVGGVMLYVLGRSPERSAVTLTPTRGGAMVSLSF